MKKTRHLVELWRGMKGQEVNRDDPWHMELVISLPLSHEIGNQQS